MEPQEEQLKSSVQLKRNCVNIHVMITYKLFCSCCLVHGRRFIFLSVGATPQ